MAITINPLTHVIYVPKADMTLVQASPEVRELDVDSFRLALKSIEDDPAYGIYLLKTHSHNTEVSLSGLTYARIVEILDPYTVEFEDGQYTVNCTGANHNLSDVKVANQVSLIVNNAAGLITNAAIEYASFAGGVTVDTVNGSSGTIGSTGNPLGTPRNPVNNLTDAIQICNNRGLTTIYIIGDATIDSSGDYRGIIFIGQSKAKSELTIDADAQVEDCEFYDATVTGTLDGNCKLKECVVSGVNYISGYVELCVLQGTITLGGGASAYFLDCWAGSTLGAPPTIDMGGSGQTLVLQNFNGLIKVTNKTGADDECNMSLNAGWVILDSTVTAGDVNIIGVGTVEDSSNGATVDTEHLVDALRIDELHKLQGLDADNPMTVTPTSRVAGTISQVISGDGETTTTVTRQ
jgi:hypothetical protein